MRLPKKQEKISTSLFILGLISVSFSHAQTSSQSRSGAATASGPGNCIVANTGQNSVISQKCLIVDPEMFRKFKAIAENARQNQRSLSEIIKQLTEISDRISKQPSENVNLAPGGFATSGGTLINPTINNNRNPLPDIFTSTTESPAGDSSVPAPHIPQTPTSTAYVTVKSVFYNPAFAADCNVPCKVINVFRRSSNGNQSSEGNFVPLSVTSGPMGAGVSYANTLFPRMLIGIVFESLDERKLTLSNIRAIDPNE